VFSHQSRIWRSEEAPPTHGGKAHPLDIIQLVDDALPAPPAVDLIACIAGRRRRPVGARKTVGEQLVDRLATPLRGGQRARGRSKTQESGRREPHDVVQQ